MKFQVKSEILGFSDMKEVELTEIDEMFSTLRSNDNENVSFTLVNPHLLRDYSFDISSEVETLLGVQDDSDLSVFNIVLIQEPIGKSKVDFLAPLVFNKANNTVAQVMVDPTVFPQFGLAETLDTYFINEA